ncbi:hypothetical protein [Nocardia fluminea]|uniref:hypothetical protein n=1 Tax=Nocardia fluminea TaxID=134984 RepID=UPI0033D69E19
MTYASRRDGVLQGAAGAAADQIADISIQLSGDLSPDSRADLEQRLAAVEALATAMAAERTLLASAPAAELTDEAAERVVLAWLWGPPKARTGDILRALDTDAVRTLAGTAPPMSGQVNSALAVVRQERPGPEIVPSLQARLGADAFDTLVASAVRTRLELPAAERPVLFRDVCMLLPVRLETLFRQHGPQWTMLLRVVPDEASVCRDDPVPTPAEIEMLTLMWQDTWDALTPAQRALAPSDWLSRNLCPPAWERFCRQVAPPRAAWLVGAYPPMVGADGVIVAAPDAAEHTAPPNRVGGFPPTLEVWCSFGSDDPVLVGSSTVDTSALIFDVVGARAETDGTVVEQADRWWVSWQAAQDVGLGLEIALPDGRGPDDIGVLYVVGIGEEHPAGHLRAQADAGELALLPLGAPTNAVDGKLAASLGTDPGGWRDTAAFRVEGIQVNPLARPLTGSPDSLPAVPGSVGTLDQLLVRALWPALWGHQLRDVWGLREDSDRLGAWAADHLRPEGPLPPVRIADQPYGLLPASVMTGWRISAEEGEPAVCEERMLSPLLVLRDALARGARDHGTAVGADTAGLLELLGRDAVSAGYAHRLFLPGTLWTALWNSTTGVEADRFSEEVRAALEPAVNLLGQEPARVYLAAAEADRLTLPLVAPTRWPSWFYEPGQLDETGNPVPAMSVEDGLARLVETLLEEQPGPWDRAVEAWRELLPDSLLVRLLLHSVMLAVAAVARVNAGSVDPLLEPEIGSTGNPTLLRSLGKAWSSGDPHNHPAGFVLRAHRDGLARLYELLREPRPDLLSDLERALRSTVDTATHRVDPWLTGMAARRLDLLAAKPDTRFRLGVYGWVDGPMLGTPGPTQGGLLHAPSHAQALTAVVLRDKQVTDQLTEPASRDLWSMQLESDRIRLAEEMAEEVRIGVHLHEALGRQVERVVGTRADVAALRAQFPMRGGQAEPGRVCSGLAALTALLSAAPPLPISPAQKKLLEGLRDALDAYGDLLVAEAVHQVVTGRADLAGAAMDAAAGLATPPTLAFTETPLTADGLTSAVVAAVPYVAPLVGDGVAPALIADASVAAAVAAATGPASVWTWGTVTLSDLGLSPEDTLVLSPDLLTAMAAYRLGSPPDGGTGPGWQRRVRDLVRALGSQPALASDIASIEDSVGVAALDAAILADLRARYAELRDEAQRTIGALAAAADTPSRVAALRRALRWGLTPMVGETEQSALLAALLDGIEPADTGLLPSLTARAHDSLAARLQAAPPVGAREPVGRAIAELAAPEGQLAVLSAVPLATLRELSGLTGAADQELDEQWLPVVAAVRPHVARLEAVQLAALVGHAPSLIPTSSAPGDHWRTKALADLRDARTAPGRNPHAALPRFVAGYGLGDVWSAQPDALVATGLVDSWSESVPRPRQTTTAAFGFNAPAARPPQAILVAVPPDLSASYGVGATTEGLVAVLADTRLLAHARAGRAEHLGGLQAAVPTVLLEGTGQTGFKIDGTSF